MEAVTIRQAAVEKECTPEAIRQACVRGKLNGVPNRDRDGGFLGVYDDDVYAMWEPDPSHQERGRKGASVMLQNKGGE